jgi:L,D-transpeptidase catalytic domain
VATASAAVVIGAAIADPTLGSSHTTAFTRHTQAPSAGMAARRPAPPSTPAPQPISLTLTPFDRQSCPAAATACVDLTRHITWLQSGGQVTFGPVKAEPGPPGSAHATPRGTFQVSWKAGPNYVSDIYNEPMPWAVFFAPGGIAFHGGSLTNPSHGCVHLTTANARYYNEHLPIGAEVAVF